MSPSPSLPPSRSGRGHAEGPPPVRTLRGCAGRRSRTGPLLLCRGGPSCCTGVRSSRLGPRLAALAAAVAATARLLLRGCHRPNTSAALTAGSMCLAGAMDVWMSCSGRRRPSDPTVPEEAKARCCCSRGPSVHSPSFLR